jgi:hypothetical protein
MISKKICMVGAFGVGKTSLVARFVFSIFSEKYQTTIGVKIDKKQIAVNGQEVTLVLWDLAGEDALTQIRPSNLKGAAGYILVVDGCRQSSLEAAQNLRGRVAETVGGVPFVLVVNKADLRDAWEVQQADLDTLAAQGWPVLLASAKSGDGVEQLFHELAVRMLKEEDVQPHPAGAGI